jgi:hypothetical protein
MSLGDWVSAAAKSSTATSAWTKGSRKLQGTLQNLGKDIGVMIRNWIGKTVFWEQVGKMFEEPDEEVTTGMAEDCRIGE